MSEQQGKQSAHTEQGEQVLDADLAQHLGLLDWSQLDPIGAGQTLTGAENEPGFFGDLGDDLLDDEGTDEETQVSEEDRDPSEGDTTVQRRRGGSAEDQATAAVVTTGQRSRSPSQGGRGLPSVTTGHVASGRGRNISSRTRSRGRISGSRSGGSSGSGTQAQGPSTEPTEPSGSGESKGMKRKAAPNLDEIEDPAERRKQRRLAKNRATAAVSRERKRVQMVQLAGRTRALEQENANLQFMLGLRDQEIARLREDLASLPRGAGGSAENPVNAVTSPTEPAALTGVALPLAATLQHLCLHVPRRSRAGLSVLACIMYFLALISAGNPPSQPHPFWAPVAPSLSWDSNSGQCELDWGAPMAWGWPFLLRLAEARRRRSRQSISGATPNAVPDDLTSPFHQATDLVLGDLNPTQDCSSEGTLQLWAPRYSSEWNIEELLVAPGSPQPAPWDPLPSSLGALIEAPHPASSSSSTGHQGWETPEQCRASSISSGSSMELPQLDSPNSPLMDIWPLQAARAQRETSSILSRVAGAEGLAARAARAAEGRRPDPALSRTAQKRRAAAVARAVLAANGVVVPEVDERPFFRVARGLPLLPRVPISGAEAMRRRRVMLLPLGMALMAAQAFVERRLYSADICKNVIEG